MSDIVNSPSPEGITENSCVSVTDVNVPDVNVPELSVSMQSISVEVDSIVETESKDVLVDIVNLTLQQMFENFLNQNKEELDKYSIKLNPDLQKYCLAFCKENPTFFTEIEESLKLIILDNTINTKDIPELLKIVMKIYEIIKNKQSVSNVDPYEVIEIVLHVLFMLYIQTNKNYDMESANKSIEQIVKIIRLSIELLKMPQIKIMKKGCLSCLFKK